MIPNKTEIRAYVATLPLRAEVLTDRMARVASSQRLDVSSYEALMLTDGGPKTAPSAREILGTSTKILKGDDSAVVRVAYLSPANEAGIVTCAFARYCALNCIRDTGRMTTNGALRARVSKTLAWALYPHDFMVQLSDEIARLARYAQKNGMVAGVRLDGTSDLGLARYLMALFPMVRFYDYTKRPYGHVDQPAGWSITYSYSEAPGALDRAAEYLRRGHGVAIVVNHADRDAFLQAFPSGTVLGNGVTVVDGDEDDRRWTDPGRAIVLLYAKGALNKVRPTESTFVRPIADVMRIAHAV